MTTEIFKASVQYNDLKGTSAADRADQKGPSTWLKENGHMSEDEFLIGIEMFAGESHGTHRDPVHVKFLLVTPSDYDNVRVMIDSATTPIEVRTVTLTMNLTEFFSLFKRFNITLSSDNMLEGKEYTHED